MADAAKSFDSNSSSTTLKETRIDNRIECSSSLPSKKFHKMALQRQDSIDHTQNISNNNQDVSQMIQLFIRLLFNSFPFAIAVYRSIIAGTTF